MRKLFLAVLAALTVSLVLWSCQKELSVETGATPDNPNTAPLSNYGWEMTGNTTKYAGCIDTAYYTSYNGATFLRVEGTDAAGNFYYILISASSGKAAKGSYTAAQSQALMAMVIGTNSYTLDPNAVDLKIDVTNVQDSLIEANFSGKLKDLNNNLVLEIKGGKFKALIGKENPCTTNSNPTPTNPTSVFTLTLGTGNACGSPVVAGTYQNGNAVTSAEKVTLKVNVTTAGTWSVTTSTVNGIKFSGSGTFSSTGAQTIVLNAQGTPTTVGTAVIPVTAGSSSCSFEVTVTQAQSSGPDVWSFADGTASFGGPMDSATIITDNGNKFLLIEGATSNTGDTLVTLAVFLSNGTIEVKNYPATNTLFYLDDYKNPASSSVPYTTLYESDPTISGTTVTLTITKYNSTTKEIEGTFSGKAKNKSGTLKDITNGKFKVKLKP